MAKKKVELFINVANEREFEDILGQFADKLVCAEIYCNFSGHSTALDRLFTKIKLDLGAGFVELIRVLCDDIKALSRLHNQSEPFYMFIVNKRVTQVFRGVNSIKFEDVARKEIKYYLLGKEGVDLGRQTYGIDEATPGEKAWMEAKQMVMQMEIKTMMYQREGRQSARKRHRAELMVPHLQDLDFVLYWPHAIKAHPELYERWDENNIIMIGREEIELTKEQALDILYEGDAPTNEASIISLLSGKALAICLRVLDPVHIVSLVRKILYEDDVIVKNSKDGQNSSTKMFMSAYDYYKTYSKTREEIWEQRKRDRMIEKEVEREKRARRFSEVKRLALQAKIEAVECKRAAREQKRMELLKSGKLDELEQLNNEVFDEEDVDVVIPEEVSYVSEEEEIIEDPDEYFPPAGLPIPGFYSPPNDVAKANGLAVLFPKLVKERVKPQNEFLPPHVLVILQMNKRYKIIQQMTPFKHAIIHMGIFEGTNLQDMKHVAYSVKQFDAVYPNVSVNIGKYRLCMMISVKVDIPLLELMDFNPLHVSRDPDDGEIECSKLFGVDYADDYPEFEDFGAGENGR